MQDPTKRISSASVAASDDNSNDENPETPDDNNDCHKCPGRKKMPKIRHDGKFKLPVNIFENDGTFPDGNPDNLMGYEIKFNIFVVPFKPVCGKPLPPEDVKDDTTEDNKDDNDNTANPENGN